MTAQALRGVKPPPQPLSCGVTTDPAAPDGWGCFVCSFLFAGLTLQLVLFPL